MNDAADWTSRCIASVRAANPLVGDREAAALEKLLRSSFAEKLSAGELAEIANSLLLELAEDPDESESL